MALSKGLFLNGFRDEARRGRLAPEQIGGVRPLSFVIARSKATRQSISRDGLNGWLHAVRHDERKTRRVEGSCIFLNRKGHQADGYTGSFGCVLHHLAQKKNIHFVDTKPDVCWQLPLRRSFETREVGEREYSITVIGEYERLAWGDGGDDFDWYCTSNTEAHVGSEPVYISNKAELMALMGDEAYAILAKHCDARVAGILDAQKRSLPLFVIQHPATLAAQK